MQSATSMFGVSFRQNPRNGQAAVFGKVHSEKPKRLNVKLPTGYGKTITALGSYAILRNLGRVNRLLMVFPTDAQIEQFRKDGPGDLTAVGIKDQLSVVDIRYFGAQAIKKSKENTHHVFAITAQALLHSAGRTVVDDIMSKCDWMVGVDEYHHYGIDASWGRAVLSLPFEHLLAMSATPHRKNQDSAFGPPDIIVKYRDAVDEKAVKPLKGHSYNYRIDAIGQDGEVVSYTTDELAAAAGSDSSEAIERFRITSKVRWSPKYVSPLVSIPIERMIRERISSGFPLQAIIGAMCVSHAELVAKQVADMFPELRVDWCGTGQDGRSDKENADVLGRFCPPKDHNGKRTHSLDVLVHVGIAGEGLDSIYVSEVIHLNKASINNSNNQENGRSARFLDGVTGHINFDSASEYATHGYIGAAIMDAMDEEPPSASDDDEDAPGGNGGSADDMRELPEEPTIQLWNVELESINSGDLEMMRDVAKASAVTGIDYAALDNDSSHPEWAKIESMYRGMRAREAERHNEQSTIAQYSASVGEALSSVAQRIIRLHSQNGARIEKSLPGDIKKRINRMKKIRLGELTKDLDQCKKHYKFLKELEVEINANGIPSWLQ